VARIGILGGTFNPPHLGHLTLARRASEQLSLERVGLVPARLPGHKPGDEDPGAHHRLHMCRLIVADEDRMSVCALEIERDSPSYTVDTLKAIHASHPDAQLTFIAGADTAMTLPTWRRPAKLLSLADLAVAPRAGTSREQVLQEIDALESTAEVSFLDMPVAGVSSSQVRRRVAEGQPIDELVGRAVASYIAREGLYRTLARAGG
jgi:nicotinate-nucleotide adenylyltransferase